MADSIRESPSARRSTEESSTAADGVSDGERLATTAGDSVEMPGVTAGAAKSLEVGAGAIDVVPESAAQRPVALVEQAARPEMP